MKEITQYTRQRTFDHRTPSQRDIVHHRMWILKKTCRSETDKKKTTYSRLQNRITAILLHLEQLAVQTVVWWKGYAESSVEWRAGPCCCRPGPLCCQCRSPYLWSAALLEPHCRHTDPGLSKQQQHCQHSVLYILNEEVNIVRFASCTNMCIELLICRRENGC